MNDEPDWALIAEAQNRAHGDRAHKLVQAVAVYSAWHQLCRHNPASQSYRAALEAAHRRLRTLLAEARTAEA